MRAIAMVSTTRRRCWITAVAAVLGTGAYAASQGAPPQQPVFRSTVDLVQVDVVVVDKSGQAVRGLKAADFQLFDRQRPQVVVAFDEVSSAAATHTSAPALASIKKDVADNRSAQSQRLVILVVDDLHIYRGRTDQAKALARQIVDAIGPCSSRAASRARRSPRIERNCSRRWRPSGRGRPYGGRTRRTTTRRYPTSILK